MLISDLSLTCRLRLRRGKTTDRVKPGLFIKQNCFLGTCNQQYNSVDRYAFFPAFKSKFFSGSCLN